MRASIVLPGGRPGTTSAFTPLRHGDGLLPCFIADLMQDRAAEE